MRHDAIVEIYRGMHIIVWLHIIGSGYYMYYFAKLLKKIVFISMRYRTQTRNGNVADIRQHCQASTSQLTYY